MVNKDIVLDLYQHMEWADAAVRSWLACARAFRLCGSAAAQCGKAPPYRDAKNNSEA